MTTPAKQLKKDRSTGGAARLWALAALLLAVHNGQAGGTRRTMEYAMRRGLQIVDIPPVMEP